MKNFSLYLLVTIMIVTGCSYLYDYYPAKLPKDALHYIGRDPNSIKWPCIGIVKDVQTEVGSKHVYTQAELNLLMNKDNTLYARAAEQISFSLSYAESERQKLIGTVEQPGYLLGMLLPIIGGFAGRYLTTLTHYSEQELQTEVNKAKNGSNHTPSTTTT